MEWEAYKNIRKKSKPSRWEIIKPYIGWEDGIALFAILIGVVGYIRGPIPFFPRWTDFYFDMRSTLVGLGLTVLIIDNVNKMYRRRAERERLILQMGSPDHGFAIEAVRQLRARKWLYDGSLRQANLAGADLHMAGLAEADLTEANLVVANLNHAHLEWADLKQASLGEANLSNAHLNNARMYKANLVEANLSNAYLHRADLRDTFLWEVNLAGAHLTYTGMNRADLTKAELTGADLRGADLDEAVLYGALLAGAKYNKDTIWPDDFNPDAAGCYMGEGPII